MNIKNLALFATLVACLALGIGCQRITKESAGVDAPKDAPPYSVKLEPNHSGETK